MYNIIVDYKVGEHVKDRAGKIYKITKISVEIMFSIELMKDVGKINLEVVDTQNPWRSYIVPHYTVQKATRGEVYDYIYNNTLAKDESNIHHVESEEERTVDDILDEINDYKSLIKNFGYGDEDGDYQKRIDELFKEIAERENK